MSYSEIKARCLKAGVLYEDPDFPAVEDSLFFSRKPPRPFEWKRPSVSSHTYKIFIYLPIVFCLEVTQCLTKNWIFFLLFQMAVFAILHDINILSVVLLVTNTMHNDSYTDQKAWSLLVWKIIRQFERATFTQYMNCISFCGLL